MLLRAICVFIGCLASGVVWSQPEISTVFTEPASITQLNLDSAELDTWNEKWRTALEKGVKKLREPHEVLVVTILRPNGSSEFSIHSRPALDEKQLRKLEAPLSSIRLPKASYLPQSALTWVKVNGGLPNDSTPFVPEYEVAVTREKALYQVASLEEKLTLINQWAVQEALPFMVHVTRQVDEKQVGVKSTGYALEKALREDILDATILCDSNIFYWRGFMELSTEDALLPLTNLLVSAAAGKLDRINRYIAPVKFFAAPGSLPTHMLEELSWRLDFFYQDLNAEIDRGIRLHEKGLYGQASDKFESLLAIYPASATLWSEWYFSNSESITGSDLNERSELESVLEEARKAIYAIDPMFPVEFPVNEPEEAYHMYRVSQLEELFTDPKRIQLDFIAYADIALDAGDHAFAAHLYWYMLMEFPEALFQGRNPLREYLYCLQQLNCMEIVNNFKPTIILEAGQIGEERESIMKSHPVYQSYETD